MTGKRVDPDEAEVSRIISAPPAEVYRAFLDPARLRRWFGPGGFTVLDSTIDARVGGAHLTRIAGANGLRGTFASEILELVPDRRIVLTWSWVAETPRPADPPQGGSIVTIALREIPPAWTEITLTHSRLGGFPHEESAGIAEAWRQALDKLAGLHAHG
jgi:uncharacterized protein YndB with AHSA1/START domain